MDKIKQKRGRFQSCTYLFTTATITVFSEELIALIDLNVNRGSVLVFSEQAGGKAHGIISMYFSVFHASILPGRQSPMMELCGPRRLKECSVQGHSSACGFPQLVVIKAL